MSAAPLLETQGLSKAYGEAFRLGPLAFSVSAGETIGILGRNGAGKTTLFHLLTGNLDATDGQVKLAGKRLTPDTPDLKKRIGYLPQDPILPRWATGGELLRYAASLHALPDAEGKARAAEDYWDCAAYRGKPLQALSYGMLKRVALALATLADPECLVLDEPFSGLDLFHVKALETELARRGRQGRATILSTHVTSHCAELCGRAFVIEGGQLAPLAGWETQSAAERVASIDRAFFSKGATA